jgi:hypothetical protein
MSEHLVEEMSLFQSRSFADIGREILEACVGLLTIDNRRMLAEMRVEKDGLGTAGDPHLPLCSHMSNATLQLLGDLIEDVVVRPPRAMVRGGAGGAGASDGPDIGETLLSLTHELLLRLRDGRMDTTALALTTSAGALDVGAARLRQVLLIAADVAATTPAARSHAAAACLGLEAGLHLFFPTASERGRLFSDRLIALSAAPSGGATASVGVLGMLFRCAVREPIAAALFPNFASPTAGENLPPFQTLLSTVLRAISLQTSRQLREPSGSRGPDAVVQAACSLLNCAQRHLLVALFGSMSSSPAPASLAAAKFLLVYKRMVTAHCQEVLQLALDAIAAGTATPDVAAACITDGFVGQSLPLLALALCFAERQLWLVDAVLPQLMSLLRLVDALCCRVPDITTAEKAYASEVRSMQMEESANVSGDRGDIAMSSRDSSLSSLSLPRLLDVEMTLAFVAARMAGAMIAGCPEEEEEEFASAWLKGSPLQGGMDIADSDAAGSSFFSSLVAGLCGPLAVGPWQRVVELLQADPNAHAPVEWEVAMMRQSSDAAADDASLQLEMGTWNAFLSDWKTSSKCVGYHADRAAFFERLLSPTSLGPGGVQCGQLLMNWLQSKVAMSGVMKRRAVTTYPDCELPYLACLLRHACVWRDAETALASLCAGVAADAVPASAALNAVWKRVMALRNWLRQEKGRFDMGEWLPYGWSMELQAQAEAEARIGAASGVGSGVGIGSGSGAAVAVGGNPFVSTSAAAAAAAMEGVVLSSTPSRGNPFRGGATSGVEESKGGEPRSGPAAPPLMRSRSSRQVAVRRRRRLRPQPCDSFDDLRGIVSARARFLLATSCVLGDAEEEWGALAALGDPSSRSGQLKEKWTSLLPPATLKPLLTRWKSTPDFNEESSLARTDATTVSDIVVDFTGDDGSGVVMGRLTSVVKPALHYVCNGIALHPAVVRELFTRRRVRACQRLYGLKAQCALLGTLSFTSAQVVALSFLRPAFRGRVSFLEGMAQEGRDTAAAQTDVSSIRHHYLKALEGSPAPLQDRVQAAFIALYTHLCEMLSQATADGNTALANVVLWNWGLDFEVRASRCGCCPASAVCVLLVARGARNASVVCLLIIDAGARPRVSAARGHRSRAAPTRVAAQGKRPVLAAGAVAVGCRLDGVAGGVRRQRPADRLAHEARPRHPHAERAAGQGTRGVARVARAHGPQQRRDRHVAHRAVACRAVPRDGVVLWRRLRCRRDAPRRRRAHPGVLSRRAGAAYSDAAAVGRRGRGSRGCDARGTHRRSALPAAAGAGRSRPRRQRHAGLRARAAAASDRHRLRMSASRPCCRGRQGRRRCSGCHRRRQAASCRADNRARRRHWWR